MTTAEPTQGLNPTELLQLAVLQQQEGWEVFLKKILMPRARMASDEVIKLAPDAAVPNRPQMINDLQLYAYGLNKFVTEIVLDMKHQASVAKKSLEK